MANVLPQQFKIFNNELRVEYSPDTKRTRAEMEAILKNALGNSFEIIEFVKGQRVVTGVITGAEGRKTYIMAVGI